jgi:predicted MFS family arabinose efflux permease
VLLIGVVAIISAWAGAIPLNYFGRRPILVVSHFSLAVTHACIGILYHYKQFVVMYVFIQFFVFWFYVGTGNVSFIYCGECCVDQAMGVVLAGLWMTEIILSFLISYMIDSPLGVFWTFMVYAFLNLVSTFYSLCLRETKGLGPRQLEELYLPKVKKNKIIEV